MLARPARDASRKTERLEACNRWTFWHVETEAGLVCLDTLRAEFRAQMSLAAE